MPAVRGVRVLGKRLVRVHAELGPDGPARDIRIELLDRNRCGDWIARVLLARELLLRGHDVPCERRNHVLHRCGRTGRGLRSLRPPATRRARIHRDDSARAARSSRSRSRPRSRRSLDPVAVSGALGCVAPGPLAGGGHPNPGSTRWTGCTRPCGRPRTMNAGAAPLLPRTLAAEAASAVPQGKVGARLLRCRIARGLLPGVVIQAVPGRTPGRGGRIRGPNRRRAGTRGARLAPKPCIGRSCWRGRSSSERSGEGLVADGCPLLCGRGSRPALPPRALTLPRGGAPRLLPPDKRRGRY